MSGFLVDTDVLSEPQKARPRESVIAWLRRHEADLYTSAVVIGELSWGIQRLSKGRKRDALTKWLDESVLPRMEGRILRLDTRGALEWGALQARLEIAGRQMPWRDSVIAATARRHGLKMATRNLKDYRAAGLHVVNPFE
jgi:toxin FitB